MLGGGRDVHADSKLCMEELHCPTKRALSMSLGIKNKKPKPAKLDTQSNNLNSDVIEGRTSRPGLVTNTLNLSGISNVSNTCYANAVVQALRFCPGFRHGLDRVCNVLPGKHPSLSRSLLEVSDCSFMPVRHDLGTFFTVLCHCVVLQLFRFMDIADSDIKVVVPMSFMSTLG